MLGQMLSFIFICPVAKQMEQIHICNYCLTEKLMFLRRRLSEYPNIF